MRYVDCGSGERAQAPHRAMNWAELKAYRERLVSGLDAAWGGYEAGGVSRDRIEFLAQLLSDVDVHMDDRRAMARLVYGDDASLG